LIVASGRYRVIRAPTAIDRLWPPAAGSFALIRKSRPDVPLQLKNFRD